MTEQATVAQEPNRRWTWQHLEESLRGLQFGAITLLVQDGVVVQIERTERRRYQRPPANGSRTERG
jgi:hypothetical protein